MSTIAVDQWLTEAVESILDQSDVSLEVLLVLDGAALETPPAWMRDPRVRTIPLAHRTGLANALRLASDHAGGEFLARMDADDISLPGRLVRSQHYLEVNPDVCVVGTAAYLVGSDDVLLGELTPASGDDVRRALVGRNQLVHPSVVMRTGVYRQVGGYSPNLHRMQDYDLWLRMALVGRIAVLPDKLLRYRLHANQSSRGAAPCGRHVDAISRGQYQLGRSLGMSRVSIISSVVAWRAAQYARYYGTRPPGYDRAVKHGSQSDKE